VYGPQHSDAPPTIARFSAEPPVIRGHAVATPHVAYSFVTKSLPALHTFDRAGGVAGTRRETKSQSSRCSYLSEHASIRAERFRNPSDPFAAECLWQSEAADGDRDTSFQAAMPLASRGLVPRHMSPRHTWSLAKTGAYPTGQTPSNRHHSALLAPGRRDPVEHFLEHYVTGQSAPGGFDEQVTHATGALAAHRATPHRGPDEYSLGVSPV